MGAHHKQLLAWRNACKCLSQWRFGGNWCGAFHEDKTKYIHHTAKPFYFRSFPMTPSFLAPNIHLLFFPPTQMWPFMFFIFLRCYYQNTNFTPQPLSWVAVSSCYRGVLWCHISVCERMITEGLTGPVMGAQWNVMLYQRPRAAQEGRCETGARRRTSAVVIGAATALAVWEKERESEGAQQMWPPHTQSSFCVPVIQCSSGFALALNH